MGFLAGGSIVTYKLVQIAKSLPPAEEIASYRFNEPSVVYDVNGVVIAELGTERRYPISFDDMPKYLIDAVVATEDARFYEHGGVDPIGILRATVRNIKARRFVEGGSTLTQQLVKNIWLSPEKKLIRKYKEAVLAYRLDHYLTKNEILEFYLNFVNFGRGAYGIQAAAINYFGKNAKELTLAECALLAGIPKSPVYYAPHNNPERAKQRREHVLSRMLENGYISEADFFAANEEPIVIISKPPVKLRHAGYFLDYVLKSLSEDLGIKDPQSLGLKVYTTLDIEFQEKAEASIKHWLRENTKRLGYFGPAAKITKANITSSTVYTDDESVSIAPTVETLMEVPNYLGIQGYVKAVVLEVNTQDVIIDVAPNVNSFVFDNTTIDNITAISNVTDNATIDNTTVAASDNSTKGVILLKDSRWAGIPYSNKQLSDFNTILSVNDVVYVLPKEGSSPKEGELAEYTLEQDPPIEAALLAVNPDTGAIYAMVGGLAFEKSMFNRAVQAKRQTGSAFKPIVYAVALESGEQPMTKYLDAPFITTPDEQGMVWRPKNITDRYYGETTFKEGITRSINIVTIKMAEKVGIRKILNYSKKFGITSELAPDLSTTIGSGSISLLELVYAYSVFPNLGTRVENPYFITRVEDVEGNILFEIDPPEHVEVIRPNTAQIMTDILVNVVEKGTGFRAKAIPRPVGAKTGTSNENRDAWFVGFIPNLAVGVWVGFDEQGNVGTGSQAAAPVWVEFVNSVVSNVKPGVFPVADGVVYQKVDTNTWEPTEELTEDISFEPYSFEVIVEEEIVDNVTIDNTTEIILPELDELPLETDKFDGGIN